MGYTDRITMRLDMNSMSNSTNILGFLGIRMYWQKKINIPISDRVEIIVHTNRQ